MIDLLIMISLFDPLVDFHPIGRFVPDFDKSTLHVLGPSLKIHKLMTTNP